MTLQPTPLPPAKGKPKARDKALQKIEFAVVEMAQRASEASNYEWCYCGTQIRRSGDTREIVIRLRPFGMGE